MKSIFTIISTCFLLIFTNTTIRAQCNTNITLTSQAEVDAFNCVTVTGTLDINDGTSDPIVNLDGLSELQNVTGVLRIIGCPNLNDITKLSNLVTVGSNLNFDNNGMLPNLDGLSSLTSIGGFFQLKDNNSLNNINGLSALQSIGGELRLNNNDLLNNINALATNLNSIGASIFIDLNASLANVNGLTGISNVSGILRFIHNSDLTDISGLSNITSVSGNLNFDNNDMLPNLDGLSGLTSVGGDLQIINNDLLTQVDDLINLINVDGDLIVQNNSTLSDCSGLFTVLNASSPDGVGGTTTISSNTTGCDNLGQVLPVELVYFYGKVAQDAVQLNWQTASELNNAGFDIERSQNGRDWKTIDFINGGGTTFEKQSYNYTDATPNAGINYYRLKQIDFNDQYAYSKTVTAEVSLLDRQLLFSPNPNQEGNTVNIQVTYQNFKSGTLTLFDVTGSAVLVQKITSGTMNLDVSNLPTGIYIARMISGHEMLVERLLIE